MPVIRTQIVRAALARVRARGGDPGELVARYELPASAETDADVQLPLRTLHAFLDDAERAARDPWLGLHMAASFPRGIYGVVEFIARNCATIREGLHRIVHYASLMTNLVQVTFEERDGAGTIRHEIAGEPLATGRHSNEFFISALVLQGRELAGARFVPARVWFAHPAPDVIAPLVAQLGTRAIEFSAGSNGLELPDAVLALPIRSADPALRDVLDREAAHSLERTAPPRSFVDEVRAAIERELASGAPSLPTVARDLGTSERTLQRRLADERLSFRELVESVREQLARSYLAELRLPIADVAFRLGYAETSAFLRAFKRWTGTTPTRWREMPTR